MFTLTKSQLVYFAVGRYDIVFGPAYQHTRTFSFPMQFEDVPVTEVTFTETEIIAACHPRESRDPSLGSTVDPHFREDDRMDKILSFVIACHQFWLHPEMVKDGYVLRLDSMDPRLREDDHTLTLNYQNNTYTLNNTPIFFTYAFQPPYTQPTTPNVFDKTALMHAVIGLPSKGFGEKLKKFDAGRFVPRLPAGDLLCIDHIEKLEDNHCRSTYHPPVPCSFALILEAALQPCGWLSHHMGCLDSFEDDTYFRNLTGDLTLHHPYVCDAPITFDVKLLRTAKLGGKMIVNFEVQGYQNTQHFLTMQTAFGYFSKQSLAKQGGFPDTLPQHPYLPKPIPEKLKQNRQFMVEEVLYANDKKIHCRRMLSPDDWYFKAHFFQDPVQPGSLGIQAFYDAMTLWCGKDSPVTPIGPCVWKYRGQTLPSHSAIDVVVEIINTTADCIEFTGKLWVDNTCIYHLEKAAIKI